MLEVLKVVEVTPVTANTNDPAAHTTQKTYRNSIHKRTNTLPTINNANYKKKNNNKLKLVKLWNFSIFKIRLQLPCSRKCVKLIMNHL